MPDYAPVAYLVTHRQLDDLAPAFVKALDAHLGKRHHREAYDPGQLTGRYASADSVDTTLVWMRDYQLLYSRAADGRLRKHRYLSVNANRSLYRPDGDGETLSLVHENGNLVVAGQWVFVGQRFIEENDGRLADEVDLKGRNYVARTEAQTRARLAEALEIPPANVQVFEPLPGEGTGHVDLFLLPLDDHTVLVPRIEESALKGIKELHALALAHDARAHLDAAADQVQRLGLKVVRVPMLPPQLWTAVDAEDGSDAPKDAVYYSPANTLLVNLGKGRKLAFLPSLSETAVSPGLKGLGPRYTRLAARALRAHGYRPIVVDATELGRWLGLFRCVTAFIPAP